MKIEDSIDAGNALSRTLHEAGLSRSEAADVLLRAGVFLAYREGLHAQDVCASVDTWFAEIAAAGIKVPL